jgi:hypothetical protein
VDIPRYILVIFTSLKIDGGVICLSFAINLAMFGNINADEFTSAQQNEKQNRELSKP